MRPERRPIPQRSRTSSGSDGWGLGRSGFGERGFLVIRSRRRAVGMWSGGMKAALRLRRGGRASVLARLGRPRPNGRNRPAARLQTGRVDRGPGRYEVIMGLEGPGPGPRQSAFRDVRGRWTSGDLVASCPAYPRPAAGAGVCRRRGEELAGGGAVVVRRGRPAVVWAR